MTDDEIMAKAAEIKARRARAARGREFMGANRVALVAWLNGDQERLDVPQDANLAAMLCRLLDCDITEGLKAQD